MQPPKRQNFVVSNFSLENFAKMQKFSKAKKEKQMREVGFEPTKALSHRISQILLIIFPNFNHVSIEVPADRRSAWTENRHLKSCPFDRSGTPSSKKRLKTSYKTCHSKTYLFHLLKVIITKSFHFTMH